MKKTSNARNMNSCHSKKNSARKSARYQNNSK